MRPATLLLSLLADLGTGARRGRCAHDPTDMADPPACRICGYTISDGEDAMARTPRPKGNHLGFAKLKAQLAAQGNVSDPAAVAAAIGRKKYGKAGMAALAASAKR